MALGLRDKAYDLCRQYLSGSWKTINKDDMVFKAVRLVFTVFLLAEI